MLHASLSGEPPLKDLLFALALAAIQVFETHRASWIKTIFTSRAGLWSGWACQCLADGCGPNHWTRLTSPASNDRLTTQPTILFRDYAPAHKVFGLRLMSNSHSTLPVGSLHRRSMSKLHQRISSSQ